MLNPEWLWAPGYIASSSPWLKISHTHIRGGNLSEKAEVVFSGRKAGVPASPQTCRCEDENNACKSMCVFFFPQTNEAAQSLKQRNIWFPNKRASYLTNQQGETNRPDGRPGKCMKQELVIFSTRHMRLLRLRLVPATRSRVFNLKYYISVFHFPFFFVPLYVFTFYREISKGRAPHQKNQNSKKRPESLTFPVPLRNQPGSLSSSYLLNH